MACSIQSQITQDLQGNDEQVSSLADLCCNNGSSQSERDRGQTSYHEQVVRCDKGRVVLVELTSNVVRPHCTHGQDCAIGSGHGGGNDTNKTPGSQERVCFVRQELDKGLWIRQPFAAGWKSQNFRACVSIEFGVDRVGSVVMTVVLKGMNGENIYFNKINGKWSSLRHTE